MEKHTVTADNAKLIWDWLQTRGGIAIWRSINLSNPGDSWTTPVNGGDAKPKSKPTWEAANEPERIITDPADVVVSVDKEVKRFHIAIRMGRQGMSLKLTDGSTRKVEKAVEKAGDGAYYRFDYETQEAVIFAPESTTPLTDYMAQQEVAA